jgi:plastocyanin
MRRLLTAFAVVLVAAAVGTAVRAGGKDGDKDNNKINGADTIVNFAQPQNQTPDPNPVAAAVTHFLLPNDVTIEKGGTVTFVVNGGGHGIAIHRVSKKTTRADIAADLCDGNNNETGPGHEITDRRARAAVCNGAAVTTGVLIDGFLKNVTGTQNLDYEITDGSHSLVIHTGFNVNFPADPATNTPAIVKNNPRVDDTDHSERLLGTSGRPPAGESAVTAVNAAGLASAGGFLTGSAPAPAPTPANPNPVGTPGNRIQVKFTKTGRFLVICMNRAHSLNDHMFGFVNVVGDDDDDK